MLKRSKELIGKTFGLLTVKGINHIKYEKTYWLCNCKCGNQIVKRYDSINDSSTPNCGCLTKELQATHCRNTVAGTKYWLGKKGNLHHSWKEIKSDPDNSIRNSEEYKIWRLSVFKRDGFKCQCCEQVGGTIHAHHIKHFAEHIELRFNIDNGITLCKKCHNLTHSKNVTEGWW